MIDAAQEVAHQAAPRPAVAQKDAAQRRRQGERVQRRDQHGHRDGHGELAEQLARHAGDEGHRHEHGQQHQRDGDDGGGDLRHRLLGRLARGQFRLVGHHALDVLHHHDGVVDHDADAEHQRQQGHGVGGVADRQQHGKGPDQADGHGDGRDDGGARRAEEQEHHQHHQHEGLDQRADDLVDRVGHEGGGVVDDRGLQALGEARPEAVQRPVHGRGGLHGIRPGREVDAERHRRVARQRALAVLVLGAELDAGDVLDLQERAVRVGAQHDVAELLGRDEAPFRLEVELELLVGRHGRGAEAADGGLVVLRLDRVGDVGGRDVQAGEALDVEPDPHGVVQLAEQHGLPDAGRAGDFVEDVDDGVVRDEQRVLLAVVRVQHHELEHGRRALADRQALQRDLRRQLRHRRLHAVVDVDGIDVGVAAEVEGHGQRVAAVVA